MPDASFGSVVARLGVVLLLVLANAFFVAAEFALVASRRTRIEAMIRRGDAKAKLVRRALHSLDRYISGTQLGITLASLGLGWVGEPAVARTISVLFEGLAPPFDQIATHGAAGTIAFAFITFLHIVLGELTPKALALLYPEMTSRWVTGPLILFTIATNPFIWALNGTANATLRLFRLRQRGEYERVHSPEEIRMLVEQSQQAGRLEKADARLLTGVFEFSEKNAREVMTPRTEMVALPVDEPLAEAADRIAAAGRSRYPVHRASLDDIAGIVHAKDILAALRRPGPPPSLEAMLRPAHFVPGSREVEDVLADMKLLKVHMVIVLDEFGGTAGLVTMEDLLEEIVGQIEDEYDRPGRKLPPVSAGTTTLAGAASLAEVNERCGLILRSDDYTTLGGYLFGALGRLPKVGDRVPVKGGVFEISAMDGRRVAETRFRAG
ncbi:MAG: HlyC/CorC family transporter [Gemmatimonadetes bacterium]|nr:HlyC/CorC family transporter [Gemmatimonadota bacterium]